MPEYSPILSLATAAFELGAAAWVWRAPGRREVQRLVAALLVLLAGYQLIEVAVCGSDNAPIWARLAFADVVWLPPLGWLLVWRLSRRRPLWRRAGQVALVLAGGLTVWVMLDPLFVTGSVCKAVIAIYTNPTNALEAYGAFYHIGLWGMIFGGLRVALTARDERDRQHAGDVVTGTVAFVVLALTTEIVFPGAKGATPSIMCHYAIALAVCFVRLARREARATASEAAAGPVITAV
ncbi:MAG: hypothetical protein U1F43_14900 [Myxococcota bacterium]